jgi:hypothetical protein
MDILMNVYSAIRACFGESQAQRNVQKSGMMLACPNSRISLIGLKEMPSEMPVQLTMPISSLNGETLREVVELSASFYCIVWIWV